MNQILLICLSILVIALTVAVVYFIFILREVSQSLKTANQMVADARRKLNALTSVLDIASTLIGGIDAAKSKLKKKLVRDVMPSQAVIVGFFAGVKKALTVLFK
ncbi:hypothetical protein A2276_05170 [candidate division WOR-1 bacterium RIFOXYA12_FULL_43_27]|uniref:DUF948 domain-containing protein n=1 Tax=candidate division WOR-1 bacterium RIFOXYC2_FULL_46_14 TaxID=1802587 RepID=A0A1F4U423_UNCSA|nr:MAG: hypothetical protein A2276_05170 [candidate division WOR-1 bacterium RIFOXYA12_FULL_43_27]OGC20057.1 MAG: hypothetical protein A2292_03175 [candidate division WOR-1 bacterium RIFOXYB2_FULL_46_45]OGC32207.1 MAG: hypothetical protein A2232_08275 [candidate division WOR-1 bacterium RIFOXYA2_FULL_46_56]OGC39607.1 MAG: hypothetical protein A2438_08640 [candidate division WOR-1 bacterium RIFOXYC2_FULL_46_14]